MPADLRRRVQAEPARTIVAAIAAAGGLALVVAGPSTASTGDSAGAALVFALALVAAPIVAATAVMAPWAGLLAWLVAMPLLNVDRGNVIAGPVQVIFSTLVVAALLAGLLFEVRSRSLRLERAGRWSWAVAGAVVVLGVLSTVGGGDLSTSVPIVLNGLIEPVILAAILVSVRPSRRQIVLVLAAMGASVTIASVYNLVRLWRDVASLGAAQAARVDFARFTYYNVGIFGDLLAMTLPLLLGLLFLSLRGGWRARGRWGMGVAAVIVIVAAYLTFTKSAWLGCLVGATVTLFLLASTRRQRASVLVTAAVVGMLVVPYPVYLLRAVAPSLADAYQSFFTTLQGTDRAASWDPVTKEGEVSINERILASEAGLRMAADHPVLGVGPGRFGVEYAGTYRQPSASRSLESPHDFAVNLAAEYGLPSTILVLAAMIGAFLRALGAFRRDAANRQIAAGLLGALAAFAVVGTTFGVDLYRPWRYMDSDVIFVALLVAVALSLRELPRRDAVAGLPLPTIAIFATPDGR